MLHVALPEAVCTLSEGHPVNVHFLATALLRVPVEAWLSSAQEISWTPWHGRLQPPNRPPTCSPRLRLSIHIFILLPPDKLQSWSSRSSRDPLCSCRQSAICTASGMLSLPVGCAGKTQPEGAPCRCRVTHAVDWCRERHWQRHRSRRWNQRSCNLL